MMRMKEICQSMICGVMMMIRKILKLMLIRQRRMEIPKGRNRGLLQDRDQDHIQGIEKRLNQKDPDLGALLEVPGPEVVLEVVESLEDLIHLRALLRDLHAVLVGAIHGQDRDPDRRAAPNLPKGPVARHRHPPVDRPGAGLALGIG